MSFRSQTETTTVKYVILDGLFRKVVLRQPTEQNMNILLHKKELLNYDEKNAVLIVKKESHIINPCLIFLSTF